MPRNSRFYTREGAIALMQKACPGEIEAVSIDEMSWTVCERKGNASVGESPRHKAFK